MAEQQQTTTDSESLRNVLIPVDGSVHSKRAFDFYLSNMCRSRDHVVVFHSQEIPTMPTVPYPYGMAAYYDEYQDVMTSADNEAKLLLRHFGDILKDKPDVTFKLVKEGGHAGEVICKNIKDENASVVVMGSRGQGTVRRTILGSVSDYVVHHAHTPICIVPPE